MRVLIVSQYFWPESFRINNLATELAARGHRVTILTGQPNYPDGKFFSGYGWFKRRREKYGDVEILRVPLVPRGNGGGVRLALNYLSFALFSIVFSPIVLWRHKFDIIFVCQLSPVTVGLPALLLKMLKRVPVIFWILDLWPESLAATGTVRSPAVLKMVGALVGFIYRGCDKIIVSSRGFSDKVAEKLGHAPPGRIEYFPNWQEPEYDSGEGSASPREPLPAGFRILFAGNIGAAQDFETILTVAERLKDYRDIHWVILGDGRRFAWVKEQVELRGLTRSFHLKGRHPANAMPEFFSQADVMLVTLKRDPLFALTVPGKIQSYMACGRPVIAALDGEGGRLIDEAGAGLSVPAEDITGLSEAILTMYRLPKEEREMMGIRGKTYCHKNFDRETLMDRLEGWMRELA